MNQENSMVPVSTNQITIIFPLLLVYSPKNIPLLTITINPYIQPARVPVTTNQSSNINVPPLKNQGFRHDHPWHAMIQGPRNAQKLRVHLTTWRFLTDTIGYMGLLMGHIWDIYGKYMGNIWEIYGTYMGNIWEIYGTYMGNIWEIYGKYMGNIWDIYGKYMGNIWDIYGKHMGNIWEIYGKYQLKEIST